jgi:hypothetical protein
MLWKVADAFIIDGVVNLTAYVTAAFGRIVKFLQNGDVQRYVVGVVLGAGLLLWAATNETVRGLPFFADSAAAFELSQNGQDVTVNAKGGGRGNERLQYKIRWEAGGDDTFSQQQTSPRFTHRYNMVGKKEITIEVHDPRWGTVYRDSRTVEVK